MPTVLARILGSLLIGTFFSSVLFGVITVQAGFYFARFKRDPIATKILVGLLWAMQGLQVAVSTRSAYYYLITSQFDLSNLLYQTWEMSYYGTHTVLVSAIVQLFFTCRLWSLSRNWFAAALIGLLVTAQIAFGFIVTIQTYVYTVQSDLHAHATWSVYSWLALSAMADAAVALALVYVLSKQRTGSTTSDIVLSWIILYGIAAGTITSVLATTLLFSYAVGGLYETLLLIGIPLGGVYIMALLANLHSRSRLLKELERQPDVCELSLLPTPRPDSAGSSVTITGPESVASSRVQRWPPIGTAPTRIASSTWATVSGTSATRTMSGCGVGGGGGTISKGTVRSVSTGITEDTVATSGTAGTPSTLVDRNSRQLRFSEDTAVGIDDLVGHRRNITFRDEQDQFDRDSHSHSHARAASDHQDHHAMLQTSAVPSALGSRWTQGHQQAWESTQSVPPRPPRGDGGNVDDLKKQLPKTWI